MTTARRATAERSAQIDSAIIIAIKVLLALVLVTPLIVMARPLPDTFFPFIVGKAIYYRTLIEIAFGLWIVLALRDPGNRAPKSLLLPILAIYVFVTFWASVFGVSQTRSMWSTYERMQGFVDIAHWLLFVWVATAVLRTWVDWRALLNFNLLIAAIMGILGLSQQFGWGWLVYLSGGRRLDITLGNPTYVGVYMMVSIMISLAFLAHSFGKEEEPAQTGQRERRRRRARSRAEQQREGIPTVYWWRAFWTVTALLSFWILFLTGTRGALIGLTVALLTVGITYIFWGNMRRVRLASIIAIASIIGLIVVLIPLRETAAFDSIAGSRTMLTRIANVGLDDDSLKGRISSARVGLRGFLERPVLGWGPENFTIAYDRLVSAEIVATAVTSFDQAHNKPIEELTTKGILGFLAYMSIWGYMVWVLNRRVPGLSSENQLFTLFIAGALAGYFAQNLFLFDTPGTVVNFYLMLSFIVFLDATGLPAEVPEEKPARWSSRKFFQSDTALISALVVTGVVVSGMIYVVNGGPYRGSTEILKSLNEEITWTERVQIYQDTVSAFPPLANYPRIISLNQLTQNWSQLAEDEARIALEHVQKQEDAGLEAEPEEWRLYLALAALYRRSATLNAAYAVRARELVEEALNLAPLRIEVHQNLVEQNLLEGNGPGAQSVIDDYLGVNPSAEQHFTRYTDPIDFLKNQGAGG